MAGAHFGLEKFPKEQHNVLPVIQQLPAAEKTSGQPKQNGNNIRSTSTNTDSAKRTEGDNLLENTGQTVPAAIQLDAEPAEGFETAAASKTPLQRLGREYK